MSKLLSRALTLLALLSALLSGAPPAFAQATDQQERLLRQLPSPDHVLAAIPARKDPIENEVLRIGMLMEFNSMAQSLAQARMPRELVDAANQYYAAQARMHDALLKQLGADASPGARQAAEGRIRETGIAIYTSPRAFHKARRDLFAKALEGELREYALAWHDSQPDVRTAVGYLTPDWVRELPPPLIPVVDSLFSLPGWLWIALLLAWTALGITFRTAPFHLLPGDVWTLQRGLQRLPMKHRVSTVIEVRESVERVTTTVEERDGQNNFLSSRTYTNSYHHVKLFLKSQDGEHAVTLTNQGFNAREGHRILEVWDPKKNLYLFFHNYDLKTFLPMDYINRFVKMRPKILIPVWLLSTYATLLIAPTYLPYATFGIPVVYLVFMNILNRRRRRKFRREMAPRMIEATSAASVPE